MNTALFINTPLSNSIYSISTIFVPKFILYIHTLDAEDYYWQQRQDIVGHIRQDVMGSALDAEDIYCSIGRRYYGLSRRRYYWLSIGRRGYYWLSIAFCIVAIIFVFGQKESVGLMLCDANYVKLLLFHLHKGSRDK